MSVIKSLACDGGCGRQIAWKAVHGLTQAIMHSQARKQGWQAPDKIGRHFCLSCRDPRGARMWWRKENMRRGLPPGYGLDTCRCEDGRMSSTCVGAGHPGVKSRL